MIRITECGGQEYGLASRACYLCGMFIDLTSPWLFLCKIRIIIPPLGFCKDCMRYSLIVSVWRAGVIVRH